jgi:hypothetical protein
MFYQPLAQIARESHVRLISNLAFQVIDVEHNPFKILLRDAYFNLNSFYITMKLDGVFSEVS